VPEETRALQHPRLAGNIDPRLPLAILPKETAASAVPAPATTDNFTLEVRGIPSSEVYVNDTYRGRIRPNGSLVVESLKAGSVEVSLDPPGAEAVSQTLVLRAARTILDFKAALPATAATRSSPLVAQIKQAMARGAVLEPDGGWALYERLIRETPSEPQRPGIETSLSVALETIGQQAINSYVNSSVSDLTPDLFRRGAVAFSRLKMLRPSDAQLEPKHLFCEGRALIIENRAKDAIEVLKRAVELDPRAAYSFNALGIAYEKENKDDRAREAFERAAVLAPQWGLPRSHLAIYYYSKGQLDRAEQEFKEAKRLDPRLAFVRLMLVRLYRERQRLTDSEKEAIELLRGAANYPAAYAELGLTYEAMKQYGRAADAFEACLRLDPNSRDAAAIRERAKRNRKLAGRQ